MNRYRLTDIGNDALTWSWWRYREADTYAGDVAMTAARSRGHRWTYLRALPDRRSTSSWNYPTTGSRP